MLPKDPSKHAEYRRKISESSKRKVISPEARAKMNAGRTHFFSEEHRKNLSESNRGNKNALGVKRSEATKHKLREAMLRRLAAPSWYTVSSIEPKVHRLLTGVSFEAQKRIHRFVVDIFIPVLNLVLEVNGCFWHQCVQCGYTDKYGVRARDEERRKELVQMGYEVQVIWEHELK